MRRTMIRRATIGRYRRPHITAQSKRLQSFDGECGTVNAYLNPSGWLGVRGQPEASRYVPAELATKCSNNFSTNSF
jgi:hypothetical protein